MVSPSRKFLAASLALVSVILVTIAHQGDSSSSTSAQEDAESRIEITWSNSDQIQDQSRSSRSRRSSLLELLDPRATWNETIAISKQQESAKSSKFAAGQNHFHVQVAAIHVDKSEFPLSKLLFRLTLRLALEAVERRLAPRRVRLSVSVRSANTCSHQYAGALAAEEYYTKRARLFIVSGCDDAIRAVSRLATGWQVPVMTAAGFGLDLNDKSIHKTLIRVAFSLRAAVEFLFKIMKSFNWRRFNLIVDESDANSLALMGSIEKYVAATNSRHSPDSGANSTSQTNQEADQLVSNTITLDMQTLISMSAAGDWSLSSTTNRTAANSTINNRSSALNGDKWPNELTERAIKDALRQCSLFSRVNVVLIPQVYLRKFMLSAHDQNMANGMYTFINMPLLLVTNDDQMDNNPPAVTTSSASSSKQSYTISTGENVFVWRSLQSSKNSQARQAFESLMSINLRSPATKAYVYFSSKLNTLANTEYATTTQSSLVLAGRNPRDSAKVQLNINPYSASFYDCLQIYGIALEESLRAIERETDQTARKRLKSRLHSRISDLVRNRRFDNMLTGSISINANGDRETDYTLDDMNQMTGKYGPVILFRGETKEIERLSRIQWSSDATVGQTIDNVDCNLIGTCPSKPLSKFIVTLVLLAAPLVLVTMFVLYFVHDRISLESQLVDYWWRIDFKDVEIISARRKRFADGSSVITGADSQIGSSQRGPSEKGTEIMANNIQSKDDGTHVNSTTGRTTTVTKGTANTSGFNSSALDVCYGDIVLGIYKLNKVALRPICKFHKSRKMMIEIRSLKEISHNNLCRFIGIVVDEMNKSIVSEFCPKGSLREFFQSESLVIDWTFRYSIINDIVAGLMYIHSSPLEFHGRLKSSNCLVSSRFVVKLSDYGPHSLYDQLDEEEEEEESLLRKQVWMAPEQLKSGAKGGSKKGDVYSFGLLIYEIITNNLPFVDPSKNDYAIDLKTLCSELKSKGPSEKIGPDLSVIDTAENNIEPLVELMKYCWKHDANKRPSLMMVNTAIKRITKGVTSKKLLENLTTRMEQYTNNLESLVDAKLATLVEEKQKAEELLYQFVPKSIASLLKEGQTVEPEAFDCVTVFYSDIVGFTSLSSESSPMEVIDFLSDLYLCFDETLEQHDIFKVDTIGDAYIVASGLPQRNEGKHVIEIACAALELRERLAKFKIPHRPDKSLEMRVGIHSGPCIAGIVGGSNMPKYCVFGDTLSIGKFMESNGLPMKIHITEDSKNLLEGLIGFAIEPRVPRINKDGLPYQTYWLERA